MSPSSDNVPASDDERVPELSSKPGSNDAPEVGAKSAEPNSSPTGGNNTRSFRFLLTLALRKAQTAVTLDNGGHIEEAIRTYREAISMLGLVLNRTNEEDGRQRLLHFRQTYSDRVSVLSSLRPSAGESADGTSADISQGQQPEKPEDSQANHQQPNGTNGQYINAPTTASSPIVDDGVKRSMDVESGNVRIEGAILEDLNMDSDSVGNAAISIKEAAAAAVVASPSPRYVGAKLSSGNGSTSPTSPTESGASLRSTPVISPVSLNKPLPSISTTEDHERSSHRDSMSSSQSMYSATQSNAEIAKDGSSTERYDEDTVGETATEETKAEQAAAALAKASDPAMAAKSPKLSTNKPDGARPVKELKLKKKDRDSEKANRRQSVKNQRSLPAMFGIGLKAKSDKAVPPPVPHLPIAETTTSTLGRRIFGALRSNSSSNDLPTSKIPSISTSSSAVGTATTTGTGNASRSEVAMLPEMSNIPDSHREPQSAVPKAERTSSTLGMSANQSVVYDRDDKTGVSFDSGEAPQDSDRRLGSSDIPPPTPAKDTTPSAFLFKHPAQPTLTKEQKRQSNAAHRLAGLFRRKPSIPEIRSPVLPPKTGNEPNKSVYGMMQSPSQMHLLPKDRRLSASASTPNLIEAAAAAASSDQPSLAVYAAAERGDIPPMPAPPALRPSLSNATPASTYPKGRFSAEESDYEGKENESQHESSISGRQMRSDSDSSSIANVSIASRMDEHRHKRQHSQTIRPSLRIATKSAMDVLSFVPEDGPVANMPMSAGVDSSNRSRKSSVATSGSQSVIRGSTGLLSGVAHSIMNGSQVVASTPLTATFPGIQMYNRPTLTDIEEDQRLEMFEPSFGTFHPDLGPAPPKTSPLSALWFINTLHRSMVTSGAYLTPSLYVPRRLWYQSGIRIAAIETKLGVLAQLTQSLSSLGTFLALPDIDMLFSSTAPNIDVRHSETVPWESEDPRSRNSNSKDELHKACVALHHWLNSFEDVLENSRRTLGRKLKYINSASSPGTEATALASVMTVPASTASHETLNASIIHMPAASGAGLGDNSHFANASLPSLSLSNSDLAGHQGAPVSPLSPPTDPLDIRTLEKRVSDTPAPMTPGAQSVHTVNRDVLNKDQMSNSRFKGFGKLGKSVDKIYSNIQKEKLDDTSVYATALQRLFEASMALEGAMNYFSRVASDADMAGWFTEVPQSPSSLANKRRTQNRGQGGSDSGIRGPMASPLTAQTTVAAEPPASSVNTLSERKSSNTSISVNSATEKKNRRRSNYFGQRQSGSGGNGNGLADSGEGTRNGGNKLGVKPRGESFSTIPMIAPAMPMAAGGAVSGAIGGGRFVLAQSPIKNPLLYVQQGKGRAPGVIYARLVRVAEWLNQVLLAWVVRDLQVLYAKYIKRLREWVIE